MTERVLAGAGTFTEVAWFGGLWWVTWQDGTVLRVTTFSPELLIQGPTQIIPIGEQAGAFPRMTVSGGLLWLAYRRGAPDFAVVLQSLTGGGQMTINLGTGYGNEPVVLGYDDIAWQAAADYTVYRRPIRNDGHYDVLLGIGRPTGLSRILPDFAIRNIDEDRFAIPGYTRPCWAGHAVAVEGQGLYDLVIRDDGKQARCFDGQDSQTPRLAWDGGERYLIGTWGKDGVRIALLENSDFVAPVPDPPPVDPPVPPDPPIPDPPKPPTPPKPVPTMTAQELANVLKVFPQDVFLDHYRAYSAQLLDRDRAGAEGISDGAVMLFFPAFYGTAADLLVQRGIPTGAPADVAAKWNGIADAAGGAAVEAYRRATGNPQ